MRNNRARDLRGQGLAVIQLAGLQKFMIAFMILALMSLPFVQPIQKKEESKKEEVKSAGDMMIEIHWKDGVDIDIDLWVKSPDDEKPVGYSNRAGKTFNLLRDDLGKSMDSTTRNFEMAYTRGLPPGEYIINLHYFTDRELGSANGAHEMPVEVIVSLKSSKGDTLVGMNQVITRKVILREKGEELTVVRFTIREDGTLDPNSVNEIQKELRAWTPATP